MNNKSYLIKALSVLLVFLILFLPACTQVPTETESEITTGTTKTETETETEAETEEPKLNGTLKIRPVDAVFYPYTENVRSYLEAGADASASKYLTGADDQHNDLIIDWDYTGEDEVDRFIFECSYNEDFSDSTSTALSNVTTRRRLTNLYKSKKYCIRVTAEGKNGSVSDTVSFETTSLGPRVLNVGGYYGNVRDMGGYVTEDGHTVLQDKVFRGSALDNCVDIKSSTLNSIGKRFFNTEVAVKTELDLRTSGENCGRTSSVLTSADNYVLVSIGSYSAAFRQDNYALYREVFRTFADEKNYPIYFHCAGGADRTGTVAAILEALLGFSRDDIIQDFVLTSFSRVGERPKERIIPVLNTLEQFNGDTLSKKTENYLLTIGLTKQEIYNIKAIMLGLDQSGFTEEKAYELEKRDYQYSTAKGGDIKLTLLEEADVSIVTVNGVEVPFEQDEKKITLNDTGLKSAGKGSLTGIVTFEDGHTVKFNVIIDELDITDGFDVTCMHEGTANSYYTYVFLNYAYNIFDGIEYHFHSRPAEFPDVEENILINGVSIKELNTQDMSKYTFTEYPGSSIDRYRVPVSILCQGNTVTLLVHTGWLNAYLNGKKAEITIKKDFEFTNNGIRYYINRDKTYKADVTSYIEVK